MATVPQIHPMTQDTAPRRCGGCLAPLAPDTVLQPWEACPACTAHFTRPTVVPAPRKTLVVTVDDLSYKLHCPCGTICWSYMALGYVASDCSVCGVHYDEATILAARRPQAAPSTPRKRPTHTAHRLAFGPGRKRTPQQKAADVAASIDGRNARGEDWTWSTYGLERNAGQQALVVAALLALALAAKEEERLMAHYWEQEQALLEDWERLEALEDSGR